LPIFLRRGDDSAAAFGRITEQSTSATNKTAQGLVFRNSNSDIENVPEKCFSSISWKEITMTNVPGSASNDQKPNTPATPQQQNQTNPPKPADKPAEQQK
jgi:hypothetical protein